MFPSTPVPQTETDRSGFLVRTYAHLVGAIALFTLVEALLFQSGLAYDIARALLGTSWLLVLGGFVVVSWLATRAAHTARSRAAQYAALIGFVLAQAVIFVPLLVVAQIQAGGGVIQSAALLTLAGFAGLSAVAWSERNDFSFLGGLLKWGGVVAILAIVGGVVFGWALGTWFSVAMVALAGAAILYDTSAIVRGGYPADRHVAAALSLFASVAMMFWYVLRLFMSRD